jgi:hypothetical protein
MKMVTWSVVYHKELEHAEETATPKNAIAF